MWNPRPTFSLAALMALNAMAYINPVQTIDTSRPKTRKTGVTYPHSSKRQRARYARQIAAGQIRNA